MECKAFETKRAAQVDFARLRRCLDLAACRDEIMTEIYHSRMTNPKPPKTFQNRRVNSPVCGRFCCLSHGKRVCYV